MASLNIVLVEKAGQLKQLCVKEFHEADLYKRAGFKSSTGFAERAEWTAVVDDKSYTVCLWAKVKGVAGNENKHDFPPPIDTTILYSTCVLVSKDGKTNLTTALWEKIEEQLFGGFHDLTTQSEGSSDTDELAAVSAEQKASGYLKDDFVVSDESEEEAADTGSELDYEEYDE